MKRILLFLLLALCLTGCARGQAPATIPETTGAPQSEATTTIPETTEATHRTLLPMSQPMLDSGTAVSFTAQDFSVDELGQPVLSLTLYDYERFSSQEINLLAPGDVLVLEGKAVTVETIQWDNNVLTLNGAPEDGGITLAADAYGQYFQLLDPYGEVYPRYQVTRSLTLTLAEDFRFVDDSDLDAGTAIHSLQQTLELGPAGDPLSTTAYFAQGTILAIYKAYIP